MWSVNQTSAAYNEISITDEGYSKIYRKSGWSNGCPGKSSSGLFICLLN